jgi:hypothetical protein
MKPKTPIFDTRKHYPHGIYWHGYLFEPVPQLGHKHRLMIVESFPDRIVVSSYKHTGWNDPCAPEGHQYTCKLIGLGRPTIARINSIKNATGRQEAAT